ncbi:MAG TPA: DUF6398 domain-containing protein [Pirellulales bacterium]|nr:DUF6398 domain-containing protein [Pirellulales bacterium]
MLLSPQDAARFFKLNSALMFHVNQQLGLVPDVKSAGRFAALPPETRIDVRKALLGQMDLIDSFVAANAAAFSADDLEIVRSWKHGIRRQFYLYRPLQKYSVFLVDGDDPIAYGVTALTQPLEYLVGQPLPALVETMLLPFNDKLIYDGLLNTFRITFGPGIRRRLNAEYKRAKGRHGIVTSLPVTGLPVAAAKTQAPLSRPKRAANRSSDEARNVLAIIVGMTDQFCRDRLNEEYAVLCRKLAEKLARKRPSPLLSGKPAMWAYGIIRTIGWVNFLHDKSQTPYMRSSDIGLCFGIGQNSGAAKLKAIRTMLRIHQLEPEWTLPSRMGDNSLTWWM